MQLTQNIPVHSLHLRILDLCGHLGSIFLLYFANDISLKQGIPRNWIVLNFTETAFTPLDHLVPYGLHDGQLGLEPFAVSLDSSHDELLGEMRNSVLIWRPGRLVLHKVTVLKVQNLEQELNLGHVVHWNLVFNFASQRAFNLEQNSVVRDAVGRTPDKGIVPVLNKSNFGGIFPKPRVVQITYERLEERPVRRGDVSCPFCLENLLSNKCIRRLVVIVPNGRCDVTRCDHIFTKFQPFVRPLVGVFRLLELLYSFQELGHSFP